MPLAFDALTDLPFTIRLGVQARDRNDMIVIDDALVVPELYLKQQLLTAAQPTYFAGGVATLAMQWDVVATVLPALAQRYPHYYGLHQLSEVQWQWHNYLTGQETRFIIDDAATLPLEPLDWLGRQVQEDLLLLAPDVAGGFPLVGGQLCFPNAWCLSEKLGQPLATIHAPVPTLAATVGTATDRLLQRLKRDRPVGRSNWALKPLPRLNLIPAYYHEVIHAQGAVTATNAGVTCYLRLEQQVLVRLPRTDGILFTVHTYQLPLHECVAVSGFARRFASTLRSLTPEMLVYKGIAPFVIPVLTYLDAYSDVSQT